MGTGIEIFKMTSGMAFNSSDEMDIGSLGREGWKSFVTKPGNSLSEAYLVLLYFI